jgi:hypothetical protein
MGVKPCRPSFEVRDHDDTARPAGRRGADLGDEDVAW